ncbi:hypothetical protein BS78_05G235000 [Paspalum vaginatum]|nr:hypothetical protein BS78_05G235000 [Paspalum vaginatum]KAJ1276704.1 hypothetical protein BS78_05G235000 [Paspalum vaginatum]
MHKNSRNPTIIDERQSRLLVSYASSQAQKVSESRKCGQRPPSLPMASAGGGSAEDLTNPLLGNDNDQNQVHPNVFPLSQPAFTAFLTKAVDNAVMGLLTLNVFAVTYLLAWAKPGSSCVSESNKMLDPKTWLKIVMCVFPFIWYPLTVYANGLLKAAEHGCPSLGLVATISLFGFMHCCFIAGVLIACATEIPWFLLVSCVVCLTVLVAWRHSFPEPKWLCNLFRNQVDHQVGDNNGNDQRSMLPGGTAHAPQI